MTASDSAVNVRVGSSPQRGPRPLLFGVRHFCKPLNASRLLSPLVHLIKSSLTFCTTTRRSTLYKITVRTIIPPINSPCISMMTTLGPYELTLLAHALPLGLRGRGDEQWIQQPANFNIFSTCLTEIALSPGLCCPSHFYKITKRKKDPRTDRNRLRIDCY
ncbi:hypothetical protein BS50DRAFT_386240 [Corynespora cassiicola Philippines]|uniref:Uncharacterized protein n=1 Tax=Corynespora cassiicola Philippines TaxID=1448308 RepID=A0A2T2NQ80_CORCC|nr:hypothetical protein BS50DRAFT_386240 [Corynespora cassiicola Philippines]